MKLLIDSASNYLFIAIIDDNNIYYRVRESKFDYSETLVEVLKEFLNENHKKVEDIEELYLGRGPGSYTGLRISGTCFKVIAYSLNVSLYSFSSLDLLLATTSLKDGEYDIVLPANKSHLYHKYYLIKNSKIVDASKEEFVENKDYLHAVSFDASSFNENTVKNLFVLNNFQEESALDYCPNYLRSVMPDGKY